MDFSDRKTIEQLLGGNISTFETVYKTFFKPLYVYAYTMLQEEMQAEEIVQGLFLKIWERKEKINIESSLKAYLYKSVYNESLNYIKHVKVKVSYENHATQVMKQTQSESPAQKVMYKNLEDRLRTALNELPEQCRTVFQMSRYEELKYREIATRLSISEKTVENHMGKALKLLRLKLADLMISILAIFFYFKNGMH